MLIDDGFLSAFIATDKKKGNEMIDLSSVKAGDKLVERCGEIVTAEIVTSKQILTINYAKTMSLVDMSGTCISHSNAFDIVSKHEPRWWLKDLPDADLFSYQWLACDEDGSWFYYQSEPKIQDTNYLASGHANEQAGHLDCIKMPNLTGDEWKQSKISIDELREWQDEYINV